MTPDFHRRRSLYPAEMRTGRRTSLLQRSRARNLDISSQAVERETSQCCYKRSPADSRQQARCSVHATRPAAHCCLKTLGITPQIQASNRKLAISYTVKCMATATRVEQVVTLFSTPGWESGRGKLRLADDDVKQGSVTAAEKMSALGCVVTRLDPIDTGPSSGALHPVRPGRDASRACI